MLSNRPRYLAYGGIAKINCSISEVLGFAFPLSGGPAS
jgi:hypothetical protein